MAEIPNERLEALLPLPRAVHGDKYKVNRGGYDCDFVEPPPQAFQTECPVCLQILKEPCLISCRCGQKFCRVCIEGVKRDNKPCPLCNLHNFTFMQDHGFERSLKRGVQEKILNTPQNISIKSISYADECGTTVF